MFKLYIVLALAVAGVSSQVAQPGNGEASAEPYSYGYETDTHAAAEQRDPNGRVTGFYTLADADGRQRRVEYVADEAGFRAKVQTNEVGTKSENSADVEVLAAPPSEAQLAPAQPVQVQRNTVQVAPARGTTISYNQQPYGYGYYGYGASAYPAGYGYGQYGQYGYASQPYGYGYGYASAPVGYGYGYSPAAYGYTTSGTVGNYNNHLPSQYYKSVQSSSVAGGSSGARYVTAPGSYQSSYRSYSSSNGPAVASQGQGSSNYIVLKKRQTEEKKN